MCLCVEERRLKQFPVSLTCLTPKVQRTPWEDPFPKGMPLAWERDACGMPQKAVFPNCLFL